MSKPPKEIFDKIAGKYAKSVDSKPIHSLYERPNLISLLPKDIAGLLILDIGCGSGWYAEYLSSRDAIVTAIDASPTMVELTKKRLGNKATVYLADFEKPLTFSADATFDIILAPLAIHYAENWSSLFLNLSAKLKKNGLLIFSTHQPHTEYILKNMPNYFEKQKLSDYWDGVGEVTFYHHTLHDLTESLYQAGFMIERMLEPMPLDAMKNSDLKMYENITTKPWFLFVRAIKVK